MLIVHYSLSCVCVQVFSYISYILRRLIYENKTCTSEPQGLIWTGANEATLAQGGGEWE